MVGLVKKFPQPDPTRPMHTLSFSCLESSFFWLKNTPTPLYLSKDKTKGQSDKNTTLTFTKTLFKK